MCAPPAATAMAVVIPDTATGEGLLVVVPSPSSPEKLSPQHFMLPPDRRAHEWRSPVATAVAVVIPSAATGVAESEVVPSPSWPLQFQPQQRTVPSLRTTQECSPVGVSARAVLERSVPDGITNRHSTATATAAIGALQERILPRYPRRLDRCVLFMCLSLPCRGPAMTTASSLAEWRLRRPT